MNAQNQLASKDCRVCNKRRVRCDRALPTCTKCEKRGLVCSGYGVVLKWVQGVASRGNLKGKSLPAKEKLVTLPILDLDEGPKSPGIQIRSSDDFDGVPATSYVGTTAIPKSLVPFQLHTMNERHLLYHYDHIVAPNMAWADCPENPWRHVIIPLALDSPSLLNAILAFAAKHINAVSFSTSMDRTSIVPTFNPDTFQQRAMKLLAREIQELAAAESSPYPCTLDQSISRNRSNAILATMLVLCNVETVWPDSPVWQVHLNAAKTVMESHQDPLASTMNEDSTSTFLEQELFIASTFASTTNFLNFTPAEDFKLNTAITKPSSIFIEFLKLLQMVTRLERDASTNPTALAGSGVSPSGLRTLFENARSQTLELGRAFQVSNADDYLHLSRTVNCFYHAGLIYSYRALLTDEAFDPYSSFEKEAQIKTSKFELFKALGFAETSKPTFAQDLVWPLFIAGTEATHAEEQAMVVAKLQQAMSETGFSNCQHALEFLNALWETTGSNQATGWIAFAREWTGQGRTFLVF